jgi:hypothetical protein
MKVVAGLSLGFCLAFMAGPGLCDQQFNSSAFAAPKPTQSVPQVPGGGASLSVDAFSNTQDYMKYEPYNAFPKELDLWNLEGKKLVRSEVVVSPDRQRFAYSEVIFMPSSRQTISKVYLVNVPPLPAPRVPRLPSEQATNPDPPIPASTYYDRFDPTKHFKDRKMLSAVGFSKVVPFGFQTLTVVDWSSNGQRLLFKQRTGVLHLGLRVSDIWVADQNKGNSTIYPAIHRVIKNYWKVHGNLPHIDELAWDIQPLGWEANSDRNILIKAWAYDKDDKKFLGLWRYDLEAGRTMLLSEQDESVSVAANGWTATPIPLPEPSAKSK